MIIGPYTVVREVGRGGMGVVYEASDPENSRTVAIKMIKGYAALDRRGRIGLVREARIAGQLFHPNIIRVYDIGQYEGWLYLVMEYLKGASLDRVSRSGDALPVPRKVQILIQLCDALNYAHTFGVVHRDVKPANTFILPGGGVKVVDFGLATQVTLHDDRRFAGTIPYMSPEQVSRGEVDGRSDIWSAGVTLYELLTGRLPFNGPTAADLCNQILNTQPPPIDASTPAASEFTQIFNKTLAKRKEERYSTARALAQDLRRLEALLKSTEESTLNDELQIGIDSKSKTIPSGPLPQQTTVAVDEPDVGFYRHSVDAVEVNLGRFRLLKPLRQLEEFWWPAVFVALLTTVAVFDFRAPIETPQGSIETTQRLIVYVLVPELLLYRALIYLLRGASIVARHPRCRSCSLAMSRTSGWTRSVKTNSEVALGYRDCIAALQENLWQDAAKLLRLHGAEPSTLVTNKLISTPLRYHLEFYECATCSHHAARLTTDDLIDDTWQSRVQFTEAYQGRKSKRVSTVTRLRALPSRIVDIIVASARHADPVRIDKRLVGGFLFMVLIVGLFLLWGRRAETQRKRMEAMGPRLSAQTLEARHTAARYYYGFGVPVDKRVAARYYEVAAYQGDGFSANQLGQMYERGIGLPQNYQKAVAWYRAAVQEGSPDGAMNLGRICEKGIGVQQDLKKAAYWYGVAANAGNQTAKDRLISLQAK